jgi:hypothetical protein
MSIICFGTEKIDDDRQWKIPFGLFFIIPTIVAAGIWFVPEVRNTVIYCKSSLATLVFFSINEQFLTRFSR